MSLRDMFPGYYLPTTSELETMWKEAIYVFDTNVLLHIYRYSPPTREQLFDSWEFVRDRIWIPHQVAREFQDRRLTVVAERKDRYRFCRDLLVQNFKELENSLKKNFEAKTKGDRNPMSLKSMWEDVLSQVDFQKLLDDYHKALDHLEQKEALHGLPDEYGRKDELRDRLDAIFGQNIGSSLSLEEAEIQLTLAQSRFKAKIPPGYCDDDKDEIKSASDGVIWLQILDYAKQQQRPIVLVTSEEKDDWCWKPNKKIWGARPELVQEMRQFANVSFILSSPTDFIEQVSKLRAEKENLAEQERIARQVALEVALAEIEAVQEEENDDFDWQLDNVHSDAASLRSGIFDQMNSIRNLQKSGIFDQMNSIRNLQKSGIFDQMNSILNSEATDDIDIDTPRTSQDHNDDEGADVG